MAISTTSRLDCSLCPHIPISIDIKLLTIPSIIKSSTYAVSFQAVLCLEEPNGNWNILQNNFFIIIFWTILLKILISPKYFPHTPVSPDSLSSKTSRKITPLFLPSPPDLKSPQIASALKLFKSREGKMASEMFLMDVGKGKAIYTQSLVIFALFRKACILTCYSDCSYV